MKSAAQHFQRATNADPNFALAQAALAATLSWGGDGDAFHSDRFTHLSEADAIARHALASDDRLSDAHLAVAMYALVREWDWSKAKLHFERAIQCDPNNSQPHEWYGLFLRNTGKTNEAVSELRIAERINSSEPSVNDFFGQVLFASRRYSEAKEKFEKALAMPESLQELGRSELARTLLWRDGTDKAIGRWIEVTYGAQEQRVAELKQVLHDQGRAAFWEKHLAAVRELSDDPVILAQACAMAGHTDEALDLLEQAYHARHEFLVFTIKTDPEWDSLRDRPRFRELLRKLQLD